MKVLLLVAALLGLPLLIVLIEFGTISPCGIVRAQVRKDALREGGIAALTAALPDDIIDGLIAAVLKQPLSPGRCLSLALGEPPPVSTAPPPVPVPQAPKVAPENNLVLPQSGAEAIRQAEAVANAGALECRRKRLSGELPNRVASAKCSNPIMIEAYRRAGYRYMDLVFLMASKRLQISEKIDMGQMTEADSEFEYRQFMVTIHDEESQRDRGQK